MENSKIALIFFGCILSVSIIITSTLYSGVEKRKYVDECIKETQKPFTCECTYFSCSYEDKILAAFEIE